MSQVGVTVGNDYLVYAVAGGQVLYGDAAHEARSAQYDDFHYTPLYAEGR
jgi:hypothetical protein